MIISYNKRCFLTIRLVVLVVFLTTFLALMAGCSSFSAIKNTTKRIRRNFKAPDSGLKKKIGIAVFENKTSIVDPQLDDIFFNTLVAGLNQSCSDLIMVKPGDPDYPDFLTDLPKQTSGVIDSFRLSRAGKQFGLNAMITSTLTNVGKNQKERGFWWFKKIDHYFLVEIFIAIYDPTTGAKLIDETFTHQVETDETEEELHSQINMISASELISAFEHIAPDMGERLCDAVIMQPWKGSILSTAADKIILPYGKSVGLKPGDVFSVYRNEETIQGFEGQKFFIPGPKTGEIKIVTVHPDRSEAIQLAGENIVPGSTIIPKN